MVSEGIQAYKCSPKLLTTNIALSHKLSLNASFYSIVENSILHYLPSCGIDDSSKHLSVYSFMSIAHYYVSPDMVYVSQF